MSNRLFSTTYDWEISVGDVISHYGRDYQIMKIEKERKVSSRDPEQRVYTTHYLYLKPLEGTENRIGTINAKGKISLVKDRPWGRGGEYYRTWH